MPLKKTPDEILDYIDKIETVTPHDYRVKGAAEVDALPFLNELLGEPAAATAKRTVLAELLRAGRPDLANVVAETPSRLKEGPFLLDPARRKKDLVQNARGLLRQVDKLYRRAGIRLPTILVTLKVQRLGMKTSSYLGGEIFMAPGHLAMRGADVVGVLIHEVAHYVHDRILSGGFKNRAVLEKFADVRTMGRREPSTEFVGGPPDFKDLSAAPAWIQQQVRPEALDTLLARLKALESSTWKRLLKKGTVFKMEGSEVAFGPHKPYVREMKVVSVQGGKIKCEVLNPSANDIELRGGKTPVFQIVMLHQIAQTKPFSDFFDLLRAANDAAVEKRYQLSKTGYDADRYTDDLNDWVPTQYALKNHKEWFAELMTKYVIEPKSVAAEAGDWLGTVVNSKGTKP